MRYPIVLSAVIISIASLVRAELSDDEISTFGGCYFARVTAAPLWRMRDQDGLIREFEQYKNHSDILIGRGGWMAKLDQNGRVTVRSHPAIEPHLQFVFENGTLVHLNADGKDCNFRYTDPIVYDDGRIVPLWPEETLTEREADETMSAQWDFGNRWTLGFPSPNQAGAVLAMVFLICLAAALGTLSMPCRIAFYGGAVLSFIPLVMTASRGAMVAVGVGLALLLSCHFRKRLGLWRGFARWKVLVSVGIGLLLLGFAVVGIFSKLRPSGGDGKSDSLRLEVLQAAPRMFCDAPAGWGSRADVGRAYTAWYQPLSSSRHMFGLVSDHLTNVVAFGWLKGSLYVFLWAAGLCALWLVAWKGGTAIPAVAWTALCVAAAFNVILFARYVSWIPLVTLLMLAPETRLRHRAFWLGPCITGVACMIAVVGGLLVVERFVHIDAPPVAHVDGGVVINGENADTWLVADEEVLGLLTAKCEVRQTYEKFPNARAIGYVGSIDAIPATGVRRLVLSGRYGREYIARFNEGGIRVLPQEIVFLAPDFGCSEVPLKLRAQCNVRIVIGEFAARYFEDYARPPKWVTLVRGAEVYIPGWMRFLL